MGRNKSLHEDLMLQILLRLPVKSLQRFKCVSKSWFSLISNPHFAKSHFELAATPTHKLLLLGFSGSEARSIDLDAPLYDHAPAAIKYNFLPPRFYFYIQIMGSCNGWFLLSGDNTILSLWNPSTGFHKQLPPSPISCNTSVFLFTCLYGFGYDESRDDYLVVQASYDRSAANLVTHFEFFSVRANSWRKIEGAHLPYMNAADEPKPGSLLSGAIHWLVFRHEQDASGHVVIAFDLMERSFSEIPLPNDFDYDCQFVDLRVLGGCLCLTIDARDGDAAVIWVMKEYRVQSSWTMTSVEIPVQYFSPICFTKSGAIVGIGSGGRLVKCDGEGQVLEDCTYFHDRSGCEAAMYTESLLSLPDESGQAAEIERE